MTSREPSSPLRLAGSLLIRLLILGFTLGALVLATLEWVGHHFGVLATSSPDLTTDQRRGLFERALRLNPVDGHSWWQLAKIELALHDLPGAQIAAERAVSTSTRYMAHQLLAQIFYARCQTDASFRLPALDALDRTLAINPRDWIALNRAARVALMNHDAARARRYLEQADDVDIDPRDARPQNVETIGLRAELAEIEGDYREARRECERGLLIDPHHLPLVLRLARLRAEHFNEGGQALALLRENWSPQLWLTQDPEFCADYTRLLTTLAAEHRDFATLMGVLRDLLERWQSLPQADRDLDALVEATVRAFAGVELAGDQSFALIRALRDHLMRSLRGDPSDAEIRRLVEVLLKPALEASSQTRNARVLGGALSLLTICRRAMDRPDPEIDVLFEHYVRVRGGL
jgi:tetratricopeptide (TPR) repeat protein